RKVYRVAVGYAVVAWLVVQISATVMPVYHAPEWILPVFITGVALGFPVALVLAWAFELKGGAIEKTPRVQHRYRFCCEQASSLAARRRGFNHQRACDWSLLVMASVAQCSDRFRVVYRGNAEDPWEKHCSASVRES